MANPAWVWGVGNFEGESGEREGRRRKEQIKAWEKTEHGSRVPETQGPLPGGGDGWVVGAFLAEGATRTQNDGPPERVQGRLSSSGGLAGVQRLQARVGAREAAGSQNCGAGGGRMGGSHSKGGVRRAGRKSWARQESLDDIGGNGKQRGKNRFLKSRNA